METLNPPKAWPRKPGRVNAKLAKSESVRGARRRPRWRARAMGRTAQGDRPMDTCERCGGSASEPARPERADGAAAAESLERVRRRTVSRRRSAWALAGLDLPRVDHVIQFDFATDVVSHLHRRRFVEDPTKTSAEDLRGNGSHGSESMPWTL